MSLRRISSEKKDKIHNSEMQDAGLKVQDAGFKRLARLFLTPGVLAGKHPVSKDNRDLQD